MNERRNNKKSFLTTVAASECSQCAQFGQKESGATQATTRSRRQWCQNVFIICTRLVKSCSSLGAYRAGLTLECVLKAFLGRFTPARPRKKVVHQKPNHKPAVVTPKQLESLGEAICHISCPSRGTVSQYSAHYSRHLTHSGSSSEMYVPLIPPRPGRVPPLTRAKLGASHFKLSSHVVVLHNPCPVIGSSSLKTDSFSFLMCYGHQSCPEATAAVTFALSFAGKRWLLVRAKAVRISSRSSLNAPLPGCRPNPIECLNPKVPAPGKTTPYRQPIRSLRKVFFSRTVQCGSVRGLAMAIMSRNRSFWTFRHLKEIRIPCGVVWGLNLPRWSGDVVGIRSACGGRVVTVR